MKPFFIIVACFGISASAQTDFSGRLLVSPDWTHSKTGSAATVQERFSRILDQSHTYGTNAGQMTAVIQAAATLTNSEVRVYELASGVPNSFGDTIAFARINVLALRASASNLGDIRFGAAAATPFAPWLSDPAAYAVIKPGGLLLLTAPDAAGYSCASGSLSIANGSTNAAAYNLYIGGVQ
jgi:hypothetical protein